MHVRFTCNRVNTGLPRIMAFASDLLHESSCKVLLGVNKQSVRMNARYPASLCFSIIFTLAIIVFLAVLFCHN